jgi:flagellar L-ring protein precursor FlgH
MLLALGLALSTAATSGAAGQESLIDADSYRGIAADQRAYRQGDVLTVYVLETTRARSGAATDASSDTGLRIGLNAPSTNYDASLGISGGSSGGAETSRIGELRAQISVQVTAVRPGGVMEIAGSQSLVVNGERQQIALSGLVRPEDVSAANTVWSHRIADAKVELTGIGTVSESQRQGILYRVFKWLRLM